MEESWDRRAHLAGRVSDVIVAVANSHFDIDVDAETRTRWSELMQLMREVDTKADEPGSTSSILEELQQFTLFENKYASLAPESFSDNVQASIGARVISILRDGERLASAETEYRYLAARRHEATQVAGLFSDTASEYVKSQPPFNEAFIPFLERLTIAANYFDSARDLPSDYKEGIVAFRPTRTFQAQLIKRTFDGVLSEYPALLHREVSLPYAKLCLVGYWSHHLKNKAKRAEKRMTHSTKRG
jgi:hypothetical protein